MEGTNRSIDLLSELPDDVLCHILSFLPTKTSVSTGLFAKRWRFLWAHVPNLLFFGDNLDNINKVIMLHEAKLVNTFRLYKVESSTYQLETLIIYSITRGVRYLYLDFDYKYEDEIVCTFPRLLLTCKTLVELKLVNCGVIPSTGELFLPSLKKLNLTYVDYEDDESLPHLISGCPVLEELIVNDCYRKEEKCSGCVNVSSPTVKMLTVDFSKGDDQFCEKMLIIDFPALVYLKVDSINLEWFKSLRKPMTSLVDVEIILNGDWSAHGIKYTVRSRSIELLSCLCHVKYLKIASYFDEALIDIEGTGSMPKFVNLTKLELVLAVNWYNVVKFLEVADNLQVLVIQISKTLPYKEPERVPTCMLSRLRTVRMYCFNACEDAFDVVRYILKNAQVLERMEISPTPRSSEEKVDALQRISLFERVPKSCQVAFNTDEYVKDVIDELKRKEREIEEKRERERSR